MTTVHRFQGSFYNHLHLCDTPLSKQFFLFQFISLHVDMQCGWCDSGRSVLVTRQVTTVWVNCFVMVRCGWNDASPFDQLTRWNLAPFITLSLFIFGLMTFWTATTFFHIFPVPASPISLCPCHCTCILSCGCVGLSVRR